MHGSAWHYIDKDMGTRRFFRQLAGQGHVVMDVAYTLAPRARLRAMVADVKRLHRDLRRAGATSVCVEFPDTDHGFDLFLPRWSPAAQAATYETERFLALL